MTKYEHKIGDYFELTIDFARDKRVRLDSQLTEIIFYVI